MRKRLLSVLVLALAAGCWNGEVNNPVSPEYPCGTRGLVCTSSPLSCCWNHQYCGAKGTRCPEDACCFDGYGTDGKPRAPEAQWSP